jgi:glycosyltransferase involved in cell wall biosynthesis
MNNSYNIAISNVIKNHWNKKGVNNIELIYDGIDLETIKEKKNYIKSKLKFIFIGSLCEGKGQLDFINSITKLDDEILNKIELHLFGSGDSKYISKIQNTIYKNNLSNVVFLDGYNENIRNEIKKFNIGIVNSKSEAFGRVTAEYMATGLCVLASNTGANQELIDNNKNGLIFEYKNYEDIRKKIMYLYNNQNLIKKYGISARKKINTNFSKEKNAENVYKLYMKVMGD